MTEAARKEPQRIRISSKRQITIPAKAYRDLGFKEYALVEQTDEGLLIKPLKVEDEGISLDVLNRLIKEGYEGEELVRRYVALCPRVARFEDLVEDERGKVLEEVERESRKYAAITRAYVFGSFARGDFAETSDVDVRLEFDKAAPFSLFEVAQFQKHLERRLGRSVEVITAKNLKNPNLAAAIEREKVLVYERES